MLSFGQLDSGGVWSRSQPEWSKVHNPPPHHVFSPSMRCGKPPPRQGLHLHHLQEVLQCLAQRESSFLGLIPQKEIQIDKKMATNSTCQLFSSSSGSGKKRKLAKPLILFSVQWQLANISLTSTPNQTCDLGTHITFVFA